VLIDNWIRHREANEDYLIGDLNRNGTIDVNDVDTLLRHTDVKADWYAENQEPTG